MEANNPIICIIYFLHIFSKLADLMDPMFNWKAFLLSLYWFTYGKWSKSKPIK